MTNQRYTPLQHRLFARGLKISRRVDSTSANLLQQSDHAIKLIMEHVIYAFYLLPKPSDLCLVFATIWF